MSRFGLELPAEIDAEHLVEVLNDRLRRIGRAIGEAGVASADGIIAYNPDYPGATSRAHWEKHGEDPSVLDWGAVGDGATDNTTALQKAINTCAGRGVALRVPTGTYLATNLSLPSNTHLYGDGPTSIIRQGKEKATTNAPFINNSDAANGNSDIGLRDLKFDGNSQNQTATRVDILNLKNVSQVQVQGCEFQNAVLRCIAGYDWVDFRIEDSSFSGWLPGNVISGDVANYAGYGGAVQCTAEYGSGESRGIKIAGNYVDGRASHSTCIKISGSLTHKARDIIISSNTCLPGYDSNHGTTLGIELWAPRDPTGLGFEEYVISGNVVIGEPAPNMCFGISVAGAGGLYGAVTANVVRDCSAYSIETASCCFLSVASNNCHNSGPLVIDTNYGGPCEHVVIANNTIRRPTIHTAAPATRERWGIRLYNGKIAGASPFNIQSCIVTGNTIDLTGSGEYARGIGLQTNHDEAHSRDNQIIHNVVTGDGTAGQRGISLSEYAGVLERTLVAFNVFRDLNYAITQGGNYNRYFGNMFGADVTNPFWGSAGSGDQIVDILNTEGRNFAPNAVHIRTLAHPTIAPDGSVVLAHGSDLLHFATASDEESIRNPNVFYLNRINYGDESQGGIISSNSKCQGDPNWSRACKGVGFTADAATDTITSAAHGWSENESIYAYNEDGALPGGLAPETKYYVKNSTTDTLQLSETYGGAAIDITHAGSGTHYLTKSVSGLFMILGAAAFRVGFDLATNAKGTAVGVPTPGTTGHSGALRVTPTGVYSDLPLFPQYAYGAGIYSGTVSPGGTVAAKPGSIYLQSSGHLWWKKTGSDTGGWVALSGLWESVDEDMIGSEYQVRIYDAYHKRPVQLLIQGNKHTDQNSIPILLLRNQNDAEKVRIFRDGNMDLPSLGIGFPDNRLDPRHAGYLLISDFVGIAAEEPLGTEKLRVVGDTEHDGWINLTTGNGYKVNGIQVVTDQQGNIPNVGSADIAGVADLTYEATERDMLNALKTLANELKADVDDLKDVLRTHGLMG